MSTLKRKRGASSTAASGPETPSNLTTFATLLKQHADKPSFLDLPPELRNSVYELVAQDSTTVLSYNTRRPLGSTSTLVRANKQVRHEFQSVLVLTADVHTTVSNFNFCHIVTFLNRLSAAELNSFSTISVPIRRTIIIDLVLQHHYPDGLLLRRWLNRTEHPSKKGTSIDYQYSSSAVMLKYDLFHCLPAQTKYTEKKRYQEELGKILKALEPVAKKHEVYEVFSDSDSIISLDDG